VLVTGALRLEFDDCVVQEIVDRDGLEVALEHGRFDLAITDYGVPWSHGPVLVRELKSRYPTTPVIMWSGTAGEAVAVEAMREGVEDFVLMSPDHLPDLVLAVRRALVRAAERRATIEAETRYRKLFENLPHGLVVTTREGSILEANPALASILGLADTTELVGRSMLELWADPAAPAMRWLETLTERGAVNDYEVQFKRQDGRAIQVRIQARVLRDERGDVTGWESAIEDVTDRRTADEDRRKLLAKLVKAQEEERQRIANDIHDDSIQVMTAVGMRLHSIERRMEDPQVADMLVKLEEIVDLSIGRLRHQLFELRPPTLDRVGLSAALRMYLEQMQEAGGPSFRLEDRLPVDPPLDLRANLYRVAQEALMNVRKHAAASHVTVTVEEQEGGVLLGVVDDGEGFSIDSEGRTSPGHLGLTAIRERAEMAGGWSAVRSGPGEGTSVQFWVPVRAELEESSPTDG
jgi:PAS domain S-box-containing protein